MLYGDFRNESIIRIIDVSVETFKLMVEFIYTDQINKIPLKSSSINTQLPIDTIIELYYCAEKYLLTDLRAKCLWEMYTLLNYQNILNALDFTLSTQIQPILDVCLKRLRSIAMTNAKQFYSLAQQADYHMTKECLQYILDNYNILASPLIRASIIEMIKIWCRTEAQDRQQFICVGDKETGAELNLDSLEKIIMNELSIPMGVFEPAVSKVSNNWSMNKHDESNVLDKLSKIEWKTCYRNPFRSTSVFKIYGGDSYQFMLKFNRITALKSIIINSRLMPAADGHCFLGSNLNTMQNYIVNAYQYQQRTISHSIPYTYNECISIKLSTQSELLHEEEIHVRNVEYNSKVFLTFRQPVIVCRDSTTKITLHWQSNKLQNIYNDYVEYPTNYYSDCEKMANGLCIQFNPSDNNDTRNLWNNEIVHSYNFENRCFVEGIEFTILS